MKRAWFRIRLMRTRFLVRLVRLKFRLLQPYYDGLVVQARYLYRQSPLFKYRWQELGLEFAESTFEKDVTHFFHEAQKEPFLIRAKIFWDAISGREPKPYYLAEKLF